jgi:hypothetical protein
MPHQSPQNDAQQNSVDGWKKACEDGPKQKSSKELKKFFGGEPYPKASKKVSEGPAGQALNLRSQFGSKKGSKSVDQETAEKEREFFGTSVGDPSENPDLYPGVEPVFTGDEREVPAGSMDDFGTGYGEDDYEHGALADPYSMSPEELKKWAGTDDSPIEKSFMYDDEPQQGHSPFDPNWADTTAFNDDEPVRTSRSSGEGFDDGADMTEAAPADETDDEAFLDSLLNGDGGETGPGAIAKGGSGAAGEMDDLGDIDFSGLDDEDFLSKLGMEPSPQPKSRSAKANYDKGDSMTWDEFRANNPDEAHEAEASMPGVAGATFRKKKSGFMLAELPDGRRMFYMGDDRGWMDMDDDGPSGEF